MKRNAYMILALMAVLVVTMACGLFNGVDVSAGGEEAPEAEEAVVVVPTNTRVANVPDPTETPEPVQEDEQDPFSIPALEGSMDQFVLRPTDLPHEYKILPGGEKPYGNSVLLYDMGEVQAKRYIVETGRVAGWVLELERVHKADIIPYTLFSQVELFENVEGAETAFSEAWLPVYQEDEENPRVVHWVEDGCDFGDECLMYYYETLEAATELTRIQYEIAFRYENMTAWIMGRGLDIDMNPEYMLDAAEIVYQKIDSAASE